MVAGLLWFSWCVFGGAKFSCFLSRLFFFERTRPAAIVRPPCLIYLSTTCVFCHERQPPQPRTLEVSLVWTREAIAMPTYTNVVLDVLSLWFIKMRCGSHALLGRQHKKNIFSPCGSLQQVEFSLACLLRGTKFNR